MKLTAYLDQEKITLTEFGRKIGRTAASVSRIANGTQWPDRETMQAIIKATDGKVSANDLAGGDPQNFQNAAGAVNA